MSHYHEEKRGESSSENRESEPPGIREGGNRPAQARGKPEAKGASQESGRESGSMAAEHREHPAKDASAPTAPNEPGAHHRADTPRGAQRAQVVTGSAQACTGTRRRNEQPGGCMHRRGRTGTYPHGGVQARVGWGGFTNNRTRFRRELHAHPAPTQHPATASIPEAPQRNLERLAGIRC